MIEEIFGQENVVSRKHDWRNFSLDEVGIYKPILRDYLKAHEDFNQLMYIKSILIGAREAWNYKLIINPQKPTYGYAIFESPKNQNAQLENIEERMIQTKSLEEGMIQTRREYEKSGMNICISFIDYEERLAGFSWTLTEGQHASM